MIPDAVKNLATFAELSVDRALVFGGESAAGRAIVRALKEGGASVEQPEAGTDADCEESPARLVVDARDYSGGKGDADSDMVSRLLQENAVSAASTLRKHAIGMQRSGGGTILVVLGACAPETGAQAAAWQAAHSARASLLRALAAQYAGSSVHVKVLTIGSLAGWSVPDSWIAGSAALLLKLPLSEWAVPPAADVASTLAPTWVGRLFGRTSSTARVLPELPKDDKGAFRKGKATKVGKDTDAAGSAPAEENVFNADALRSAAARAAGASSLFAPAKKPVRRPAPDAAGSTPSATAAPTGGKKPKSTKRPESAKKPESTHDNPDCS